MLRDQLIALQEAVAMSVMGAIGGGPPLEYLWIPVVGAVVAIVVMWTL